MLSKNIYKYLSYNVIVMLISLLTLPIITRFLTPNEYGKVGLIMSYVALLLPLLSLSLNSYLPVYIAKGKKSISKFNIFSLLLHLLVFLSIVISKDYFTNYFIWHYMLFALLLSSVRMLKNNYFSILVYKEYVDRFGILNLLVSVLSFFISIGLFIYYLPNGESRIMAFILSEMVVVILCAKYFEFSFSFPSLRDIKDLLRFSLPVTISIIPAWFINEYGKILLKEDLLELGLLSVSFQIGYIYMQFNSSLINAFIRKLYENIKSEFTVKNNLILNTSQFCVGVVCLIMFFILKDWVLGEEYRNIGDIVIFSMLGYFFQSMSGLCMLYINYFNLTIYRLISLIIGALTSISILYFLNYHGLLSALNVAKTFSISMFIYSFFVIAFSIFHRNKIEIFNEL